MLETARPVGVLLREWRQRRRMSQLQLALDANVSARHLSFIETGRSQPSREMLLHLAEQLAVPLRQRNALLLAAGLAPEYAERSLDDPALDNARRALDLILKGHEPFPALLVDRHWTLVAANRALQALLGEVEPTLLRPPINALRLSLHPLGLASRIVNYHEWRTHLLARLRQQIDQTGDAALAQLHGELQALAPPSPSPANTLQSQSDYASVLIPLRLATEGGVLSLFSTITIFGTPVDITLSELALESFYPADAASAELLRTLADASHARSN